MLDFDFTGLHNCDCVCGLQLVYTDDFTVVIVSQRPDNTGSSITNAAETLARQALDGYSLEPEDVVWIEHYPALLNKESWDLVRFDQDGDILEFPIWDRITGEQVESICRGENPFDKPITMIR